MDDENAIAIVGVGCKFPGADNLTEFWKVLVNGENHVNEITSDRWNLNAFYSDDKDAKGKTYVRRAGLLKNHDVWDNKLFGISDVEAEKMDPQQRYVLDCIHMALEDGGITRKDINGTDTGVYIGFMNDDYRTSTNDGLDILSNYSLTGSAPSVISARVSYIYNLLGPSMAIDTACSSALVAIDVAIQALKSKRCQTVIAGGVNAILNPDMFVGLSRARMVSEIGQSQAFSANADGYARGEGCGVVILKTLKQAIKDNNTIWALIATGCNQDGRTTTPITAPSGTQQVQLLKTVYGDNKIDPANISVIEAHGTGTPVGDPIEANSLGKFFGNLSQNKQPIHIGSVKTNIGHTESAAGTAGLIKILLMMKHKTIVPSLHFETCNPKIDFDSFNLKVPLTTLEWTPSSGVRYACVNSFGFGGTNSHAVVKEYKNQKHLTPTFVSKEDLKCVFFSAMDKVGLQLSLENVLKRMNENQYSLIDLEYTSICRRDHFSCREAIQAADIDELKSKCNAVIKELNFENKTRLERQPYVIAVFCGVGTTWTGMCYRLINKYQVFDDGVNEVDGLLKQFTQWSIKEILKKKEPIKDPLINHIAIFTCQIALWHLWKHLGLKVDVVVGQSVGEVAAAYTSGVFSLETAVQVIYYRSLSLSKAVGGQMFVIGNCPVDVVEEICKKFPDKASIAVYISSTFCTVSCDDDIVESLKYSLRQSRETTSDIIIRNLHVRCAYHSKRTEAAGAECARHLKEITGKEKDVVMISTVTGEAVTATKLTNSEYWRDNIQKPVLFKQAIIASAKKGRHNIFLEIGPKPVLNVHLSDSFDSTEASCLPSMKEMKELETIKCTIKDFFRYGIDLKWQQVIEQKACLVDIPRYVMNGKKHLFVPNQRQLKNGGMGQVVSSNHLLVTRTDVYKNIYRMSLDPIKTPFVYEHYVSGTVVVPGALYAEVALEVGTKILSCRPSDLAIGVNFIHPFSLLPGQEATAEITVRQTDEHLHKGEIKRDEKIISIFEIYSKKNLDGPHNVQLQSIKQRCSELQDAQQTYQILNSHGFQYGLDLQILKSAWKNDKECLVEIELSDAIWKDVSRTHLHPVILDGLLQMIGILEPIDSIIMPSGIDTLTIKSVPERLMFGYALKIHTSEQTIFYNVVLFDFNGHVIVELKNYRINKIGKSSPLGLSYRLDWHQILVQTDGDQSSSIKQKTQEGTILFVSFSEVILGTIKDLFQGNSVKTHLLLTSGTVDLTNLQNTFRELLKTPIREVVFVPGYQTDHEAEGCMVLEHVHRSCITSLAILQVLCTINGDIKFSIITENTQMIKEVNEESVVNIHGAELWGQIRSVIIEKPLPVKLVDLHVPLDDAYPLLTKIIFNQKEELALGHANEFIITKYGVFTNCLQTTHNSTNFRKGTFDSNSFFALKSQRSNLDTQLGIFCTLEPFKYIDSENYVSMHVHSFCKHHAKISPQVIQEQPWGFDVFEDSLANGFQVVTFEVVGKLYNKYGQSKKTHDSLKDMVACYTLTVKNIVSVPEVCTLDKGSLPWYTPGLVTTALLMWTLTDKIDTFSSVLILRNKDNTLASRLLQTMLQTLKQCKVETVDSLSTKITIATHNIIPLVMIDNQFVSWVNELFHEDQQNCKITCLSIFSQSNSVWWCNQQINHLKLDIIEIRNILCHSKMIVTVPVVYRWLQQHLSSIPAPKERGEKQIQTVISLPFQSISMEYDDLSKYVELRVPPDSLFRPDGCYIVVGGLTGLGAEIIKFLASQGAGYIVSFSRRKPNQAKLSKLDSLSKSTGCNIHTLSTDITNMESLQAAFDEIEKSINRPIKGIFQGAGFLNDSLFVNMTENHYTAVLSPKVLGTWNLHRMSLTLPLDYFVMHSSMTSVFGNQGQTNYGAANSFEDTLAYYRRSLGLPGQSINWGPLSLGMAAEESGVNSHLISLGYLPLTTEDIVECFVDCLKTNSCQVICGSFDWSKVAEVQKSQENDCMLNRIRPVLIKGGHKVSFNDKGFRESANDFANLNDKERTDLIRNVVFKTAKEVFMSDSDIFNDETVITDLGIDSMQAMTFVNRMNDQLNYRLPVIHLLSGTSTFQDIIEKYQTQILKQLENVSKQLVSDTKSGQQVGKSITNSMTPFEKICFDSFKKDPNNKSSFLYADIEVSKNMFDANNWKKILHHVHENHDALRTLFVPAKDDIRYGIKRKVLDIKKMEIDFQEVEMSELTHVGRIPKNIHRYAFDPRKTLPLRTFFAVGDNKCRIRFVFSHIAFDLTSIIILMKDIRAAFLGRKTETHITKNVDVAVLYETCLQLQYQRLRTFWKERIPAQLSSMTLAKKPVKNLDPEKFSYASIPMPEVVTEKMFSFLKDTGLTLFDFMASVYQLLLYCHINVPKVAIATVVDLRLHFPELEHKVCRFTNQIPLIASFEDNEMAALQFFFSNKTALASAIDHSILPMKDISGFVQNRDPFEIRRHVIIMEHISDVGKLNIEGEDSVEIKKFVTTNSDNETMLVVWNDHTTKHVHLELGYSTLIFSNEDAESLSKNLVYLIEWIAGDPQVKIKNLTLDKISPLTTHQILHKKEVETILKSEADATASSKNRTKSTLTNCETINICNEPKEKGNTEKLHHKNENNNEKNLSGIFMKQTKHGWDHQVSLRVIGDTLTWGTSKSKLKKTLPISEILSVDYLEANGKHVLVIATPKRHYTFKTTLQEDAEGWMDFLRTKLQ